MPLDSSVSFGTSLARDTLVCKSISVCRLCKSMVTGHCRCQFRRSVACSTAAHPCCRCRIVSGTRDVSWKQWGDLRFIGSQSMRGVDFGSRCFQCTFHRRVSHAGAYVVMVTADMQGAARFCSGNRRQADFVSFCHACLPCPSGRCPSVSLSCYSLGFIAAFAVWDLFMIVFCLVVALLLVTLLV